MFLVCGLRRTSAAEAGILTGATPAITAILAGILLREYVGIKKGFGILCTVTGVLLIQGLLSPDRRFSNAHIIGNLLVLCAAACESVFNILSRITVLQTGDENQLEFDPLVQTTLVTLTALVLCICLSLTERPVAGTDRARID